jgi:hypothetical protein
MIIAYKMKTKQNPHINGLTHNEFTFIRLFSTHPCTSSLILVVEGGRKEGKTKASFDRNIRGLLRDAEGRDGPPTIMEVCVLAAFSRELLKNSSHANSVGTEDINRERAD